MATHYKAGTHLIQITNQGFGEANNENRTPFFFIEFRVLAELVGKENPQQVIHDKQYPRTIELMFSNKSIEYVRKKLARLGWTGDDFEELDPHRRPFHSFIDKQTEAKCEHEDGWERWDLVWDGDSSKPKESVEGVARKLNALFGKSRTSTPPAQPTAQPAAAPADATKAASPPDDDIPFAWLLPFVVTTLGNLMV